MECEIAEDTPTFYLQFIISDVCNLKCKHCYNEFATPETISRENGLKVIDQYAEFLESADRQGILALSGGEPFMHPNILEFITYAKSKGVKVVTLTNGLYLTEDLIQKLNKLELDHIQISLDGATKESHDFIRGEGTFVKTCEKIKLVVDNFKGKFNINTTLNRTNIQQAEAFFNLFNKLGVKNANFSAAIPLGFGVNIKGKCGSCPSRQSCGGCRAVALAYSGDLFEEDITCPTHITPKEKFSSPHEISIKLVTSKT